MSFGSHTCVCTAFGLSHNFLLTMALLAVDVTYNYWQKRDRMDLKLAMKALWRRCKACEWCAMCKCFWITVTILSASFLYANYIDYLGVSAWAISLLVALVIFVTWVVCLFGVACITELSRVRPVAENSKSIACCLSVYLLVVLGALLYVAIEYSSHWGLDKNDWPRVSYALVFNFYIFLLAFTTICDCALEIVVCDRLIAMLLRGPWINYAEIV